MRMALPRMVGLRLTMNYRNPFQIQTQTILVDPSFRFNWPRVEPTSQSYLKAPPIGAKSISLCGGKGSS